MTELVEDPPGSGLYIPWDWSEVEAGLYESLPAPTAFSYRGVHIDQSGPFYLQAVEGWAEVAAEFQDVPVGGGHGSLVTPGRVGPKSITVSGVCASEALQNSLFWALRRMAGQAMTESNVTSELVGEHGGVQLTADVQLSRWQATVEQARWTKGVFGFDIEFRMCDPLFYGGWQTITSTLAQPSAGLALPTSLPAAFPPSVPGGLFPATNDGTALAPAIYTLPGPMTSPGVLLNSGTQWQQMVQYDLTLVEGDSLVIDTAKGSGLFNGEYRPPSGTSGLTKNLALRPGVNTVQALGNVVGTPDPWPSITCSFRPAYW